MTGDVEPDGPFAVDVATNAAGATLRITGEVDISVMPVLQAAVAGLAPAGRVVLDLREVGFMDSTGIRLIMGLDVRSRAEGWDLVLVRGPGPVANLLELCRVPERVDVRDEPPAGSET